MNNPTVSSFGGYDPAARQPQQKPSTPSYSHDEVVMAVWTQQNCPNSLTERQRAIIRLESQAQAHFNEKQAHFNGKAAGHLTNRLGYDAATARCVEQSTKNYNESLSSPASKTLQDFMQGGKLAKSEELKTYLRGVSHTVKRQAQSSLGLTHHAFNVWLFEEGK